MFVIAKRMILIIAPAYMGYICMRCGAWCANQPLRQSVPLIRLTTGEVDLQRDVLLRRDFVLTAEIERRRKFA
jgi:hypothetical protein